MPEQDPVGVDSGDLSIADYGDGNMDTDGDATQHRRRPRIRRQRPLEQERRHHQRPQQAPCNGRWRVGKEERGWRWFEEEGRGRGRRWGGGGEEEAEGGSGSASGSGW